jgi:hypothetical protein
MITVVAYKNGQAVRHEQCYDVFEADVTAEDMKECGLYDEVHIEESDNGTKKTV